MCEYTLITGATGGLGKEFSYIFSNLGNNLVLSGTNIIKLNNLKDELLNINKNIDIKCIEIDLSENNASKKIKEFTDNNDIFISTLINNAGFGNFGEFIDVDYKKQDELINVNIKALTELTYLYALDMKKHNKGNILNVGSIASFVSGPLFSTYYASKNYVLAFSEALSIELKKYNINVSCLCPGTTKTGFEDRANLDNSKLFKRLKVADPKKVAQYGYKLLKKKKVLGIYGFSNKLLIFLTRLAPRKLVNYIILKIQEVRK